MIIHNNIRWNKYKGVLIPAEAPNKKIILDRKDKHFLLSKSGTYFLRWIENWDIEKETQFWYIIKDTFGGFEELSSNTRNQVRKGLKNCDVKKVTGDFIIQNAYDVYLKAHLSYKTGEKPINRKEFEFEIKKNNYDFWTVSEKTTGKTIAYGKNLIQDNICLLISIKHDPEYLKLYSSYALFYTMNKYYLENKKVKFISNGARSIFHETNIQKLLISKFKYRKSYCNMKLEYNYKIRILVFIIYPFKKIFYNKNINLFKKITVLLKNEEIARECKNN